MPKKITKEMLKERYETKYKEIIKKHNENPKSKINDLKKDLGVSSFLIKKLTTDLGVEIRRQRKKLLRNNFLLKKCIIEDYEEGMTYNQLQKKYGVSPNAISYVTKNVRYKNLTRIPSSIRCWALRNEKYMKFNTESFKNE